jgi:hypothetical protein
MMMLDETVVGIAREGERVEPERIDRPAAECSEPRPHRRQMRQVETDDVVADQEASVSRKRLKPVQRLLEPALPEDNLVLSLAAHRREGEYPCRAGIDLKVDGDATGKQATGQAQHGRHPWPDREIGCRSLRRMNS